MNRIRRVFTVILVVLTVLWLGADTLLPEPLTYFAFRNVFVQYTGVLALGVMSLAMVLAVRPRWPEHYLDGLDKMYRLHKWLGGSGLVLAGVP